MKTFKQYLEEVKEPTGKLKDACWKGYTAVGTKKKNGRTVPNCVPEETELDIPVLENEETWSQRVIDETAAWQRKEGKSESGGLTRKGIASYRKENPGSKLSMAVTTKPSKLKPGSKAANRRKSFSARMSGMRS